MKVFLKTAPLYGEIEFGENEKPTEYRNKVADCAVAYISIKAFCDLYKILYKEQEEIELHVSLEQLCYQLSGKWDITKSDKTHLERGIKCLEETEVIQIKDSNNGNYVLNVAGLYIHSKNNGDDYDELYVKSELEEIRNIFNLGKGRNYGLLRFTMLLFTTLNNGKDNPYYKCGFMARETIVDAFGLSGNQIYQDYFKMLEDNNIIYVHRSKRTKIQEDKSIKTLSNIYGRFEDKAYVDSYAVYQEEEQAHDFRRLPDHAIVTKDYNKYCRKPEKFSKEQAKELYDLCRRYNDMPLQREGYIEKYDLSVFSV